MIRFMVILVNHVDQRLIYSLFDWRRKRLFDRFFFNISRSANGPLYGIVGTLFLVIHDAVTIHLLVAGTFGFMVELSLYKLIKNTIQRPRPCDESERIQFVVAPPDKFSFPSGHTAAAFLMAILISSGFPQLQVWLFAWAGLVGISRVYLGVHYPTDVMMGAILGIGSATAGLVLAGNIL